MKKNQLKFSTWEISNETISNLIRSFKLTSTLFQNISFSNDRSFTGKLLQLSIEHFLRGRMFFQNWKAMDDLRLLHFDNLIDTDSELLNYKVSIFISLIYLPLSLMRPSSLLTVFFDRNILVSELMKNLKKTWKDWANRERKRKRQETRRSDAVCVCIWFIIIISIIYWLVTIFKWIVSKKILESLKKLDNSQRKCIDHKRLFNFFL